jgi:hypothetical protein
VASLSGVVVINPVIYAELSAACRTIEALEAVLDTSKLDLLEMPRPAQFLTARKPAMVAELRQFFEKFANRTAEELQRLNQGGSRS